MERLAPLLSCPADIHKPIYTTNAIESVNMSLRKATKNRGSFPNDEPMIKLPCLAPHGYRKDLDDADPDLGIGTESVYDHLR